MAIPRHCRAPRCKNTRRRGSDFCVAHYTRYRLDDAPCNGEAHNPAVAGMIDNCGVCMPRWGTMQVLVDTWRCPKTAVVRRLSLSGAVLYVDSERQCLRVKDHNRDCIFGENFETLDIVRENTHVAG